MAEKLGSSEAKYEKSKKYSVDFPASSKVNAILYAHFLRINIEDETIRSGNIYMHIYI